MNNNLRKIEKELRAFAKRCKDIKYTQELLLTFLMSGSLSFAVSSSDNIERTRKDIKTSITDMKKLFKDAKRENNKLMKQSNLELIQLMEQGDHVVKSPWSSWQYGENYYYNEWNGIYKGKGDKKEKYPYEGIFERSNGNERYISTSSKQYSKLITGNDKTLASTNKRSNIRNGYGLVGVKSVVEPIIGFDVNAGIRPKQVSKGAITITDKNPVAISQPEAIINVPNLPTALSFSPVTPSVTAPTAPTVVVSTPPDLSFNGTGFGQGRTPLTSQFGLYVENYHEYDTTAPVYLTYTATGRTMTGGTVQVKLDNGTAGTSLTPGTSSSQGVYFINDAADHSVTIKGNYDITRASDAGNGTLYFVSLNRS